MIQRRYVNRFAGKGVFTAMEPPGPISVAADDPRIAGTGITFPDNDGATIMAYEARPSSQSGPTPEAAGVTPAAIGALPVVLICHENRRLTDHIKDVATAMGGGGLCCVRGRCAKTLSRK